MSAVMSELPVFTSAQVTDKMRAKVVEEARTWIHTPYHHAADVKGHGVDCAMLLVAVYTTCKFVESVDPRPYPQFWYLHRDEERYLGWIEKFCHKTATAQTADIAVYRFGRTASHASIIIDDDYMIHAYAPAKKVEIVERKPFESRLDGYWGLGV